MKRIVPALLASLALAGPASAERLTIAVSAPNVVITSNFIGAPITVFGVIDQAPAGATPDRYRVAVLVTGHDENIIARRKDRVAGVWVNDAAATIGAAPAFYALSSVGPAAELASQGVLKRLELGFDNIGFTFSGAAGTASGEFRDAYVRLKRDAGLYAEQPSLTFVANNLVFRSSVNIPANIPVGRYQVLAYVFSAGDLVASAQDAIDVSKSGPEGLVSAFARGQSLAYGIICAGLALFVGWAGGVIFRRD
ncbi:MAG TPA: TIGR02186 family protein [Bauldia sp.]|nr:TIGR02186 family protein [Bauldia sp.]